ncbi:MAG: hypothetical protein KAG56_04790 [Sulfurovaceae bacterium]|nr:hypothetical protein [Sulfurovaceae bacterium]
MKLKFLLYTLIVLATSTLHAEWETITLKEHIAKSSLIVVAEFGEEVEKKEGRFADISQLVSFESNETIKGEVLGQFFVKGQSVEACMPQMLFSNTLKANYLLFLEQEGNSATYNLIHGERSALIIENGMIGWVKDVTKIDLGEVVPTSLKDVIKYIRDEVSH